MPINATQLAYLKEMGIPVWQRRSLASQEKSLTAGRSPALNEQQISDPASNTKANDSATAEQTGVEIDISILAKKVLFTDLLQAINKNLEQVKQTSPNTIQIDELSWSFYQDSDTVKHQNSQLQSPEIDVISTSPQLKKALWSALSDTL